MKKLILFACFFILTNYGLAQYGGFIAGVEFSKPIFSGISYPRPGFIVGFLYHDLITRKEIDFQIEFTINHYLSFNTIEYPYYQNQVIQDYMIEERKRYYTSVEITTLFEFPEIFAKSYPNIYLGFSVGYSDRNYESKIVRFVPELHPIITDFEPSPLPIPVSVNAGLSYSFKSYTFDLRYKLTQILFDENNFMQNIYLVIRIHPRD